MSAPTEHALLSASGAHKWIHCPPSARVEEGFPEMTSEYAEEGRLAHAIAELKLRKHFLEPMGPRKFANALKKLQEDPRYNPEMLQYTDAYLEYIQALVHSFAARPHIAVERRVEYGSIAPEGFGTCDCIVIGGDQLHIIDFKYGKGVEVTAEMNPQMLLYAAGALQEYRLLYHIASITTHIVQPRKGGPSCFQLTPEELDQWAEKIKPQAQQAFMGLGDFNAGDHCRFCRAKARCRARADAHTALQDFGTKPPPLLSNDEIGQILGLAQTLEKWAKDVKEYALQQTLLGNDIPGWKAVEGRSVCAFDDPEAAFAALREAGVEEALLYKREPLSLAAVEKLLGKKDFQQLLGAHIITPPGAPTLAPESDKREAIKRETAEDDFGKEN